MGEGQMGSVTYPNYWHYKDVVVLAYYSRYWPRHELLWD